MKRLRIGYFVQQFPPEVGAGAARVPELALRWRDAGAEVTVITAMPNRPQGRIYDEFRGKLFQRERWNGLHVLRSWLFAREERGFAATVANNGSFMITGAVHALLRAGPLDVLIGSSPPWFVHAAADAVARLRRVPLVLEVRDLWPDYLVGMGVLRPGVPQRMLFAAERRLLQRAKAVVVVTGAFRSRVVAKGVPPERVEVIPNGADLAAYYREDAAPPLPALERRPGILTVGYLGNFGAGQGLQAVVDAAAMLARRRAPVRFVLCGDGPERKRVVARAREASADNIAFAQPIARNATRAFYNMCDICLVPLAPVAVFQETIPSKLFEIMACERPVLASLDGEAADVVARSGCGLTVPPGNAEAIAGAVLELAGYGEQHRARLGAAGRAFVAQHFSRTRLADDYLRVLRRVAEGSPPPSAQSARPVREWAR